MAGQQVYCMQKHFLHCLVHHTVRSKEFEGTTEIYIEHMHICIRREPPLGDIRKLRNRILDRRLIHPLVSWRCAEDRMRLCAPSLTWRNWKTDETRRSGWLSRGDSEIREIISGFCTVEQNGGRTLCCLNWTLSRSRNRWQRSSFVE